MSSVFKFIFFIVLAGLALFFVRDSFVSYPSEATLVNNEGKKIEVRLQGRYDGRIYFQRIGSERDYVYPESDLSMWTRVKLLKYPERMPEIRESSADLARIHRQAMLDSMASLESEIAVLLKKMDSANSKTQRSSIARDISNLKKKVKELKYKIARFENSRGI